MTWGRSLSLSDVDVRARHGERGCPPGAQRRFAVTPWYGPRTWGTPTRIKVRPQSRPPAGEAQHVRTSPHRRQSRCPLRVIRRALDVSLTVDPGTVLAVLGANGAGKARWLLRAVSSWCRRPRGGSISSSSRTDITGKPANHVRKLGLVYIPEEGAASSGLTVRRQPPDGRRTTTGACRGHRPGHRAFPRCWALQGRSAPAASPVASSRFHGPGPRRLTEALIIADETISARPGADRDQSSRLSGWGRSSPASRSFSTEQFVHLAALAMADACVVDAGTSGLVRPRPRRPG